MKASIVNILKLTFVVGSLILISCDKTSDTNFSLDGKLDNLSQGDIYAVKEISNDSLIIDTIKVSENGEFKYEGKVTTPTLVTLFYSDSFPSLQFFLEKDYSVQIRGDANHPSSIEIKGGAINNDLNEFKKKNQNLLVARERAFGKNEHFDPAELKNLDFQLARSVREYVAKNPTKLVSVILMNEFSKGKLAPELLSDDIASLQGQAADYYLTTSLKKYNDKVKSSSIGAIAPPIELKSTKGKMVSLNDFKDKNVLLIFDLKESPANQAYFSQLKDAQKKLKNKVSFVSIVIDEDIDSPDPQTLNIANSLDWTVLLDCQKWNSKEVIKYNVTTVPYMILLSPDGKIVERDVILDSLIVDFSK